jgi:hypothetical protein
MMKFRVPQHEKISWLALQNTPRDGYCSVDLMNNRFLNCGFEIFSIADIPDFMSVVTYDIIPQLIHKYDLQNISRLDLVNGRLLS